MSEQLESAEQTAEEMVELRPAPVGEQLKAAREARGLAVAEIAQTLKLGARQVLALENGEWQSLPGPTFIRGFVRNYARLVQIDPAPLMQQLDGLLQKPADTLAIPETRPAHMMYSSASGGRRDKQVIVVGVVLLVVAALVYFLLPSNLSALRDSTQSLLDSLARHDEAAPVAVAPSVEPVFPPGATPQQIMNPQAVTPADPSASGTQAAGARTDQVAADAGNVPQMRFVFEKESWLEVRDRNDFVVFSKRASAGTEHALSGEGPLSVVVGNAPGVKVFWRGQAVDLAPHTRGDVARFVLE